MDGRLALLLGLGAVGAIVVSSCGGAGASRGSREVSASATADEGPDVSSSVASTKMLGSSLSVNGFCREARFGLLVRLSDTGGSVITGNVQSRTCTAELPSGGSNIKCALPKSVCRPAGKNLILVVLDDSGSMGGSDPSNQRGKACEVFVDSQSADNLLAVAKFNDQSPSSQTPCKAGVAGAATAAKYSSLKKLIMLQDFTADKAALKNACNDLQSSGGTPLYQSTAEGIQSVLLPAATAFPGMGMQLLLLSDGAPTDTAKGTTISVASNTRVAIHTVGLGEAALGATAATTTACTKNDDCTAAGLPQGSLCKADPSTSANVCFVTNSDNQAAAALQELSFESRGAFMSTTDASQLSNIFTILSDTITNGHCFVEGRLSFSGTPLPKGGDTVKGAAQFGSAAGISFDFLVPTDSTGRTAYCHL